MFELDPDLIKTNILSKFENDWVKTVAARVLTRKLLTDDARRTTDDGHSRITNAHPEPCLGELKKDNNVQVYKKTKNTRWECGSTAFGHQLKLKTGLKPCLGSPNLTRMSSSSYKSYSEK